MNENYVTYEQAIKLYNHDFDSCCLTAYFDNARNHTHNVVSLSVAHSERIKCDGTDVYPAPPLHIAHKWIREHLNHYVNVFPVCDYSDDADGRRCAEWNFWTFDIMNIGSGEIVKDDDGEYETYELALSAGIDKVFEIFEECL